MGVARRSCRFARPGQFRGSACTIGVLPLVILVLVAFSGCSDQEPPAAASAPPSAEELNAQEPPASAAARETLEESSADNGAADVPSLEQHPTNGPPTKAEPSEDSSAATAADAASKRTVMPEPQYPGGLAPPSTNVSQAVADVLVAAREAMAERDLVAAGRHLRAAVVRQSGVDDAREVERLWLLDRLLGQFWSAVRHTRQDWKVGDELSVSGKEMKIVSIDDRRIIVDVTSLGRRRVPIERTTMSAALAVTMAEEYLAKSGPYALRPIAAFQLLDKYGNRAEGERLCRELQRYGLEVDPFLPELDRSVTPTKP